MNIHVHAILVPGSATKRVPSVRGYRYLVFHGNEAVGMAVIDKVDEKRYWINSITVDERSRGGKFGSVLLQRIVDDADRDGTVLELSAVDADPGLMERKVMWYRRYGFVEHPESEKYKHMGTWMIRHAVKHRVRVPPPAPGLKIFTRAEIERFAKRVAKRVKREFAFTGSENTMEPLPDAIYYQQLSDAYENLNPWQQRYVLSQAMDPNVESNRTPAEAHQEVAEYTYAFHTIPLDRFPVSYWEQAASRLVVLVDDGIFDDETWYLATQIQRVFDLQLKIDNEGFDRKQPIVVLGIATNNPRFGIDNGHHRIQALRNLARQGKAKPGMAVPVVIRFRKDVHGYGRVIYRGITDVHHFFGAVIGPSHWPATMVLVRFTFGKGKDAKVLSTYMKRLDSNTVLVETAMPLSREPKIDLLRAVLAYIRKQKPGVKVVSKPRYPGDLATLRRLERDGAIDCIVGETCDAEEAG
jgi:GNAT superfamily N-acetyltransferase